MRVRNSLVVVLSGLALLAAAPFARADVEGRTRVASGLSAPIFVTHAPGDASRLFIAERGGAIKVLDLNTGGVLASPFLTTTVNTSGEGGLLGLAFHPDYNTTGLPGSGKLYLNLTTTGTVAGFPLTTRIREYS